MPVDGRNPTRQAPVVALAYDEDEDYIYVVTVHWLDPEKWEDPWTRGP
jgi:hypothetical protein